MIGNDQLLHTDNPTVCIEPSRGWAALELRNLCEYRELLYFLIWRDLKVRYKQTVIGMGWVVIQPLAAMVIFSVIFGNFVKVPSDGLPYPIFAYSALLPWSYFAGALNRCIVSVVADAPLIAKIYFPRLILPLAGTVSGLIDFAISFVVLLGVMLWFGLTPTWWIWLLPVYLLLALVTALAAGLWLSVLNVKYRDIGYAVPFLIQLWMFLSPVVYPVSIVPEKWRLVYSLNPMVSVIEGFRWALLGKQSPDAGVMAVSAAAVFLLLVGGIVFFKNMEETFADVV